jgi:hypothetical protein
MGIVTLQTQGQSEEKHQYTAKQKGTWRVRKKVLAALRCERFAPMIAGIKKENSNGGINRELQEARPDLRIADPVPSVRLGLGLGEPFSPLHDGQHAANRDPRAQSVQGRLCRTIDPGIQCGTDDPIST